MWACVSSVIYLFWGHRNLKKPGDRWKDATSEQIRSDRLIAEYVISRCFIVLPFHWLAEDNAVSSLLFPRSQTLSTYLSTYSLSLKSQIPPSLFYFVFSPATLPSLHHPPHIHRPPTHSLIWQRYPPSLRQGGFLQKCCSIHSVITTSISQVAALPSISTIFDRREETSACLQS